MFANISTVYLFVNLILLSSNSLIIAIKLFKSLTLKFLNEINCTDEDLGTVYPQKENKFGAVKMSKFPIFR